MALFPSKEQGLNLTEEDLNIYFAKNAKSYLRYWKLLTNQKYEGTKFSATFHRPAFFLGPVWYFYRKLYLEGAIIFIGTVILGLLLNHYLPTLRMPVAVFGVVFAAFAQPLALRRAYHKIMQVNAMNLDEAQRKKELETLGGTSYFGLGFGILIVIILVTLAITVQPSYFSQGY